MSTEPGPSPEPQAEAPKTPRTGFEDVEEAVADLSRMTAGVVGHLFGAKAIGKATAAEVPSVTPGVDQAIDAVSDTIGKVLSAVGEGIGQLPVDAEQAVKTMGEQLRDTAPPPRKEGWSGLSSGLAGLAKGIGTAAERVAHDLSAKVNPKPVAPGAPAAVDEAPAPWPTDATSPEDATESPPDPKQG